MEYLEVSICTPNVEVCSYMPVKEYRVSAMSKTLMLDLEKCISLTT